MRVYALMLGIMLTVGYGYTAQMAVSSVGHGHAKRAAPPATPGGTGGELWYGGVLDPVTVESKPVTPVKGRVISRQTVRCVEATRSALRAIS